MTPRRAIVRSVLLVAGVWLLAGCTYSAEVRNKTAQPVFVQMLQIDPIQPDWVLDSKRVAPGEYAKLGPKRVPFQRVVIDVGDPAQKFVNGRTTIRPGTTLLDVGATASTTKEETVFTLERRDQ